MCIHSRSNVLKSIGFEGRTWFSSERGSSNNDIPDNVIAKTLKVASDHSINSNEHLGQKNLNKPSIMQRIKNGLAHYWHGSKLLVYETRISSRLLFKLLRGEKLIRREYRQLVRTSSDLLRLIPFLVILVVPFLEFALPIILKLFPNFLPSTFEDKLAAEEKIKKQLKIKLETAKFLQEAVENMAVNGSIKTPEAAKQFSELFQKCRMTGQILSADEIATVCRQLEDSITLENLSRPQLASICRYMGINAFGTDAFLRFQIRKKMETLHTDDLMIDEEGVGSLTEDELRLACQARGIRTIGTTTKRMMSELNQWLDLHLRREIPAIMIILSRAFSIQEAAMNPEEALQAAIMALPEHVVEEAELQASETLGADQISPKKKLQVLEQQQELITEELAQEEKAREAALQAKDLGQVAINDGELTREQIENLSKAINVLSSNTPVDVERKELQELKEEREEYKEDLQELQQLAGKRITIPKAAHVVGAQLEKLLQDIGEELESFEGKVGNRLQLIQTNTRGELTTGQLELILQMLKDAPKDSKKIAALLKKVDKDGDGKILLSDIFDLHEKSQEEGQGIVLDREKSEQELQGNKK